MPTLIEFLTQLSNDQAHLFFKTASHHMAELSLDRYSNAFEEFDIDLLDAPILGALKQEYVLLCQNAGIKKIEGDEKVLDRRSQVTVQRFANKLFMFASLELLDQTGQLKKEIVQAFQLKNIYSKIAEGEMSEYKLHLQNVFSEDKADALDKAELVVRNEFIKGFIAQIIKSLVKSPQIQEWLNVSEDTQLTFSLVNRTLTQRFLYLQLISRLKEVLAITPEKSIIQKMLLDKRFYNINISVSQYCIHKIDLQLSAFIKNLPEKMLKTDDKNVNNLMIHLNLLNQSIIDLRKNNVAVDIKLIEVTQIMLNQLLESKANELGMFKPGQYAILKKQFDAFAEETYALLPALGEKKKAHVKKA